MIVHRGWEWQAFMRSGLQTRAGIVDDMLPDRLPSGNQKRF